MASSIVISTVKQLGDLLVNEGEFLYGVSDKIKELQTDLRWMHAFLEDADNRQHYDKRVSMWISEIRDFTYEAQEIIERYVYQVSHPRQEGWRNTIRWLFCALCDAPALHELGSNINNLRSRMEKLKGQLQLYGVKSKEEERFAYNNDLWEQRQTYSHIKQDPIGLENHTRIVVEQLVTNDQVKVVGIWGMGGLGKITLARQVFQDTTIRGRFKKSVWVCISKQFDKNVVFREILAGLANQISTYGGLPEKICKVLKEQDCLVVLDDIWTNVAWDILKPAFDSIKSSSSKILITTRNNGLMKHVDPFGYPHNPNLLDEEDSWKLLRRIIFPKRENRGRKEAGPSHDTIGKNETSNKLIIASSSTYEESESDQTNQEGNKERPSHDTILKNETSKKQKQIVESSTYHESGSDQTKLEDGDMEAKEALGREMLKHCKGLPLAILSLGGILCNKKTIAEWQAVQKNMASHLMGDTKHGRDDKGLFAILELSFKDLPFYLKPCFMYLGMFLEDFPIRADDLYHLWEAEGLVTVSADDGDEVGEMRLDDIAELYLNELVERCLVQVDDCWGNGRIYTCRLHDVVRDMCLKKCKEVNFLRIIKPEGSKKPSSKIASSSLVNGKLRRCALYLRETNFDDDLPFDTNANIDPCIRSLLVFQHGQQNWGKKLLSSDLSEFLSRLRVLSLAEFSNASCIPVDRNTSMNFIHLRYLSFTGAKSVKSLPTSIGDCKYLETLYLRWTAEDVLVSNMFWKLERLRHLWLPYHLNLDGSERLRLEDNQLEQMETLENFNVDVCKIEDLEKMKNMRSFSFTPKRPLSREEVQHFLSSPMTRTKRLKIPILLGVEGDVINEGASLLTAIQDHVGIAGLRIIGRIDSADNLIEILQKSLLTELRLMRCEIGQEEISVIEKLPRLKYFSMWCFLGEKLSFSSGGFPHLKSLTVGFLPDLEDLEIGEGALFKLEKLKLYECKKLKMIPQSLPNSVCVTCKDPCINGVEKYNICPHSAEAAQLKNPSPSSTST